MMLLRMASLVIVNRNRANSSFIFAPHLIFKRNYLFFPLFGQSLPRLYYRWFVLGATVLQVLDHPVIPAQLQNQFQVVGEGQDVDQRALLLGQGKI